MRNFSELTIEPLLHHHTTRSQIIYITALLALLAAGIAACFIKIPITVQARGIVRPLTERTEIKSIISEKVTAIYIYEGQTVQKGDTLLTLNAEKRHIVMAETATEIDKQQIFITDLRLLLSGRTGTPQSTYYRAQESSYRRRLFELETRLATAEKAYERAKILFAAKTIALVEMEQEEQAYRSAASEVELLESEQKTRREDELSRCLSLLNELQSRYQQYNKELQNYALVAPVSGTVEQFAGIYTGSLVMAGHVVAVISPDESILIECYVQPKDIAFVCVNDTARVQIDAFPYTQWGMLQAQIIAISDDYHAINDIPMFRVRCIPENDKLYLKNGFSGRVKKGMTALVRFPVTERTLYQLLFDKVNDWLHPALN
jgi:HlyD family secretion protein